MKLGHTAINAFAFLGFTMLTGDLALAQTPIRVAQRPRNVVTPATGITIDFDTTRLHARYNSDDLQLSGTVTLFQSDGTTPAAGSQFALDIPKFGNDVLGVCFTAANQARMAGGQHTLRMSVNFYHAIPIADGKAVPAPGNVNGVICEIDP